MWLTSCAIYKENTESADATHAAGFGFMVKL